jgi:hypothetical protein
MSSYKEKSYQEAAALAANDTSWTGEERKVLQKIAESYPLQNPKTHVGYINYRSGKIFYAFWSRHMFYFHDDGCGMEIESASQSIFD